MKKFSLKPVIFMLVLTLIYTGILATINHITAERIALNALVSEQRSFLYALDFDVSEKDAESIYTLYSEHVSEIEVNGITLYEAHRDGVLIAYVIPMEGDAVWGNLKALIALSPDFSKVLGLDILSHSETPGLGGRIDESSFKEQFRGILINTEDNSNYIVYKPNPKGQVDAISGATGTSNALSRILNQNLHEFFNSVKEGL